LKKIVRITTVPVSFRNLLRGQLKYMKQFYEIIGISSPGEHFHDVEEFEEVPMVPIKMERKIAPFSDVKALIQLYDYFKKNRPHIVHTHTPKAGLLGMLAAKWAGVPIRLHTVAGLPLVEESGLKKRMLLFTEKLTYAAAHRVLPNSYGLKEIIVNLNLTSSEKLQVLAQGSSNGINLEYFNKNAVPSDEVENVKQLIHFTEQDFVFLFVGRLVKDKGIVELIEAFTALQNTHAYAKLVLVGKLEPERDELPKDVLNTIDSNPKIHFVGFQKDVRPFMMAANALVFPSYREGLPNVPMQAGALELPAIVTNINGCNEIVKENVNGYLIPTKNKTALLEAMKKMMDNDDDYNRFVTASREQIARNYDQKKVWKAIQELYDENLKTLIHD
jgi:glycosyltransferase involved in cell wall biosynthesis